MTTRKIDSSGLEFAIGADKKRFEILTREGNLFRWFTVPQLRAIFRVKHAIEGILSELEKAGEKVGLKLEKKGDDEDAQYRFVDTLQANISEEFSKKIQSILESKTSKEKIEILNQLLNTLILLKVIPTGIINMIAMTIEGEKYEEAIFINGVQEVISSAVAGLRVSTSQQAQEILETRVSDTEIEDILLDTEDRDNEEVPDEGTEETGDALEGGEDEENQGIIGVQAQLSETSFASKSHFKIYQIITQVDSITLSDLGTRCDLSVHTVRMYIKKINGVLKRYAHPFLVKIKSENGVYTVVKKIPKALKTQEDDEDTETGDESETPAEVEVEISGETTETSLKKELSTVTQGDFKSEKHYTIYTLLKERESIKLSELAGELEITESTLRAYISETNGTLKEFNATYTLTVRKKDGDEEIFYVSKKQVKSEKRVVKKGVPQEINEQGAEEKAEPVSSIQLSPLTPEKIEEIKTKNDDLLLNTERKSINGVQLLENEFTFFLLILSQRGKILNVREVLSILGINGHKDEATIRSEIGLLIKNINKKFGRKNEYLFINLVGGEVGISELKKDEQIVSIGGVKIIFSASKFYIKLGELIIPFSSAIREFLVTLLQDKKVSKSYEENDDKLIDSLNMYFVEHDILLKLEKEDQKIFLRERKKLKYDTHTLKNKKSDILSLITKESLGDITLDSENHIVYFDKEQTIKISLTEEEFTIYIAFLGFIDGGSSARFSISDLYTIPLGFETLNRDFEEYFGEISEIINLKLPKAYRIREEKEDNTISYYLDFNQEVVEDDEIVEFEPRQNLKIKINITQSSITLNGKEKTNIPREIYDYILRYCRNLKDGKKEILLVYRGHPEPIVQRIKKGFMDNGLPFDIYPDKRRGKLVIELLDEKK